MILDNFVEQVLLHPDVVSVDGPGVVPDGGDYWFISALMRNHDHKTNPQTTYRIKGYPAAPLSDMWCGDSFSWQTPLLEVYDNRIERTVSALFSLNDNVGYFQMEGFYEEGMNNNGQIWSMDYDPASGMFSNEKRLIAYPTMQEDSQPDAVLGTLGCSVITLAGGKFMFYAVDYAGDNNPPMVAVARLQPPLTQWNHWFEGGFSETGVSPRQTGLFNGYFPHVFESGREIYCFYQRGKSIYIRSSVVDCPTFWYDEALVEANAYYPWVCGDYLFYCIELCGDPRRLALVRRRFEL